MKNVMLMVMVLCLTVSLGMASTFNVANGDWSVAENWDPVGLPGSADVAAVNGGNVANFNTTASVSQLQLGTGSDGTLNISGGTLTTGNVDKSVWIGDAGATGTLNMTGGQIVSTNRMSIGGNFNNNAAGAVVNLSGDAKISQTSGTHAAIGFGTGSVVDITMSGNSVMEFTSLASSQYVDLRYGDITVTQSDNSMFYSSGNIRVGGSLTADVMGVDWTMTGGTIEADNGFFIYNSLLDIGGDAALFAKFVVIGADGESSINISGLGTLNLTERTVSQVEAMFGTLITGDGLVANTVDIGGVAYTQVSVVPEPATLVLLASGMLLLKRRKGC